MKAATIKPSSNHQFRLPRLIGQMWGTTNLGDCLTVLKYAFKKRELVQGPVLQEYEQEFARKVDARFAFTFASGRAALFALLKSYQIESGEEVLLQVPTHIVVPSAIRFAGGTPVFVDCKLDTFNMNLEEAEQKITSQTRFIVIQHTFGIPVDMDAAVALAKRHNLILIEDCVHALGATYHGRPIGSFGQAAFFSTEETKIISSTMGGMAVTSDPVIAEKLKTIQEASIWPEAETVWRYMLKLVLYYLFTHPLIHRLFRPVYMWFRRNPHTHLAPPPTSDEEMHGKQPVEYVQRLGNGQAAIALRQLRRLDANLRHRREIAETFRRETSIKGYHLIKPPVDSQPAYVRFPIMVTDRVAAAEAVADRVILGKWFSSVLEESASPEYGGYLMGSCPNAELASKHLINLPTHFRIQKQDVKPIVDAIAPYAWRKE